MRPKHARTAKQCTEGQFNEREPYATNNYGFCLRHDCAFGVRANKEDEGSKNDRATIGGDH
jgi:hypothetical protein